LAVAGGYCYCHQLILISPGTVSTICMAIAAMLPLCHNAVTFPYIIAVFMMLAAAILVIYSCLIKSCLLVKFHHCATMLPYKSVDCLINADAITCIVKQLQECHCQCQQARKFLSQHLNQS